jgi:hypothetical protein
MAIVLYCNLLLLRTIKAIDEEQKSISAESIQTDGSNSVFIDERNVAIKFAKKQAGIIRSTIIGCAITFTLLLTVFLSGGIDANGNITALSNYFGQLSSIFSNFI